MKIILCLINVGLASRVVLLVVATVAVARGERKSSLARLSEIREIMMQLILLCRGGREVIKEKGATVWRCSGIGIAIPITLTLLFLWCIVHLDLESINHYSSRLPSHSYSALSIKRSGRAGSRSCCRIKTLSLSNTNTNVELITFIARHTTSTSFSFMSNVSITAR